MFFSGFKRGNYMFDLFKMNKALGDLQKGKEAELSDMQIVNCIIGLPAAQKNLDGITYSSIEAKYAAYNKKREKRRYDQTSFQSRAAEIAYDFTEITDYENICGAVPLQLKIFIGFCKGSYERLEDDTYKAMMVLADDIYNYLLSHSVNVDFCTMYGAAITYVSIILSIIVQHETNPDYMSTLKHMRSLTRDNLKEVVTWHAFHRFENVVEAFLQNKCPKEYDEGTWAKKASLLLNDYSDVIRTNLGEKEKCFEISKAYLRRCDIEITQDLVLITSKFIDYCDKLLK
jgi:hypothetical protein